MNKLTVLKIKNYQKKALELYSYLNIIEIYSSLDYKYKKLYDDFHKSNKITVYEGEFHIKGIVDHKLFTYKRKIAQDVFIDNILNVSEEYAYVTIGFQGISYWAKIKMIFLKKNLERFFADMNSNFFFITEKNRYAIQLYQSEYQWEVLVSSDLIKDKEI